MSQALFGLLSAVVIVGALLLLAGPQLRLVGIGGGVLGLGLSAFAVAAGDYQLGVLIALGLGVAVWLARTVLTEDKEGSLLGNSIGWSPDWLWFVVPTLLIGGALAIVTAISSGWHSNSTTASLITIFHYRYRVVLAVLLGAAVVLVALRRALALLHHDEVSHTKNRAARQQRAESVARRRADREAARRQRRDRRSS